MSKFGDGDKLGRLIHGDQVTPQEKLKHIKQLNDDAYFWDNPNGSDVYEEVNWLITRVEQLEKYLNYEAMEDCSCGCHLRARKALSDTGLEPAEKEKK